MRFLRLFFLSFLLFILWACGTGDQTTPILYVTPSADYSPEDSAALHWLNMHRAFHPRTVTMNQLSEQAPGEHLLWVHISDSTTFLNWMNKPEIFTTLKNHYEQGADIVFSGFAAYFPFKMGVESREPVFSALKIEDNWNFDKKGFQSYLGHPLFTDLFGGSFVWDAFADTTLPRVGYFGDTFPEQGKVVATEKSYITIHSDRKLVFEYENGAGKILSIGAFIYFNEENRIQYRTEKLLTNAFLYLNDQFPDAPVTYWQQSENIPREFEASVFSVSPSEQRNLSGIEETELLLTRDKPDNQFYDQVGRRALIMGYENGGIDEFWVHPFRVVRNYETGLLVNGSLKPLSEFPVKVEIRPESFTRIYQTPAGNLTEIIFASLDKAGGVVHYRAESALQLMIKFRSDVRWMWPYDEKAPGDLFYDFDEESGTLHVKDSSGNFYCLMGADIPAGQSLSGQYENIQYQNGKLSGTPTDLNQVYHAALYNLDEQNDLVLNVGIVGTNEGAAPARENYLALLQSPVEEYNRNVRHYQNLLDNRVVFDSPDKEFNTLWKWTLVATDKFWAYTPGVGTGLLAGYSTTARGWDGRHKISGRPGYAWYFGRDSEWSGFAIDDYGDLEMVKEQLNFLQKYQDASGKIFHEISTSGVVHYDAADATPLYVILAAHYLRASGNLSFIRENWQHIKKAMDFMYTTDTDGDLLIENTNVGHGWVEGGKLWGANTTFYLAGSWAQTLKDAAYLARHAGKNDLASRYEADALRVVEIVNTDFWNDSTQFFNYGKFTDGTYNPERTVFPAVVMYFGILEDDKVQTMLQTYASNEFTSNWGVRTLSRESPLFSPHGYHYGSIWPLFTGWTALAEYEYGHSAQGFTHIINSLYIKNHWALGYVEEVMNGAVYQPTGVCPHQCWSETNILHPGINGMIGWKPSAPENTARLAPRFPLHWSQLKVNNLRMGDRYISVEMQRDKNITRYLLRKIAGSAFTIQFAPEIPSGMVIENITVNNTPVQISTERKRGLLNPPLEFELQDSLSIILEHTGGIGVMPLLPRPQPGDDSEGFRITRSLLNGKIFEITVEGLSGTTHEFGLQIFDNHIMTVEGAEIRLNEESGQAHLAVSFDKSDRQYLKKNIRIILN